jgi:hypothetical protein
MHQSKFCQREFSSQCLSRNHMVRSLGVNIVMCYATETRSSESLPVVTTCNYYTITHLHSLQSLHTNIPFCLFGAPGIHLETLKTANCLSCSSCLQDNPSARTTEKTHLPILLHGRLFIMTFLDNGRSGRVCHVTCGNVEFTWYSPTPGAIWHHRGMFHSNHINTWQSPTIAVWRHRVCAEICLPCWLLEAGCIRCCIIQQWVDMSQYLYCVSTLHLTLITLLQKLYITVKPRSIVPGYIVFPDPSFNFCGPWTNPI